MKMFESLNDYLNESFLGYTEHGEEVFKNPKSIKRMTPNIKGIIGYKGDLFVIDAVNYIYRGISDIISTKFKEDLTKNVYKNFDKEVAVQRVEKTDIFYLSESYLESVEDHFETIKRLCIQCKKKNPYLTFVLKKIDEAQLATDFETETVI